MKKKKDALLTDLEKYLHHLNKKNLSQITIESYFKRLRYLITFLVANEIKQFSQITLNDFAHFELYLGRKIWGKFSKIQTIGICKGFLRFIGLDHLFAKKGIVPPNSPLVIELKDFRNYLIAEKGYSKNTLEAYQRDVTKLINYLLTIQVTAFDQVNQQNFTQFLATLYNSKLSANSIRRALEAIKTFFKFLKREGIIKVNPITLFDSPKFWQRQPDILTQKEVIRIIETPNTATEMGLRDRAILEMLYGSGMRISELCELRFKDFNLDDRIVRIFGKGGRERLVPFTGICLAALCAYWLQLRPNISHNDYAIVTDARNQKLNRINIWHNIKNYAKQSELAHKNVSPHTFRHCFATHMLDNGAELKVIQDLLGHVDISTTGVYLRISIETLKKKFYKHHPRNEAVEDSTLIANLQAG